MLRKPNPYGYKVSTITDSRFPLFLVVRPRRTRTSATSSIESMSTIITSTGSSGSSFRKQTVADGISRTDDGYVPSSSSRGPRSGVSWEDASTHSGAVEDASIPSTFTALTQRRNLKKSHEGEWHGDPGLHLVKIRWKTYLYAACAALNSCNMGYDMGATTGASPKIQAEFGLTDVQLEFFVGLLNLCAIFGSLFSHFVSDRCGRRGAFLVAAVGFMTGILIMVSSTQYSMLMLGQMFVGLGVGFGLALDPVYIAEVSPAAHRGELVSWSEIGINIGIVFGFISDIIFDGQSNSKAWRGMLSIGLFMPMLLILCVIIIMPESPRWLVSKGRENDALQVLKKIYPEGYEVNGVLEDIRTNIRREDISDKAFGWGNILFPTPAVKRMLIVGVGVAICQQAVGVDAIQYFLVFILEHSGVDSNTKKAWILAGLGLVKLAFVVVASKQFDKRGRRPLMFLSCAGMTVALIFLSINFYFTSNSWFAVASLALYLATFSIGMGPGAWLIPSEVFSTKIRAKAMSLATFTNRITATLMSSTFLSTANAMSWAGFFSLLAFIVLLVALFFYIYLPETNGHSLEDMTLFFAEITGDRAVLEGEFETVVYADNTVSQYSSTGRSIVSGSRQYRISNTSLSSAAHDSSSRTTLSASTVGQMA